MMKKVLIALGLILATSLAEAYFLIDWPNAIVSTATFGIVPYGQEPGLSNWGGAIAGTLTVGIYKPCCCNGCNDSQCCCNCNTCSKGRCNNY